MGSYEPTKGLRSIKIRNFRCLKNVDVQLDNFNVLIGPNDSGKTTFIETLIALKESMNNPLVRTLHTFRENVWEQKIDETMLFEIEHSHFRYKQQIVKDQNSENPLLIAEEACIGEENIELVKKQSTGTMLKSYEERNPTKLTNLIEFIENIEQQSFNPNVMKQPIPRSYFEQDLKHKAYGLRSDGYGLAAYLMKLKLEEDEIYSKIVETLRKEIPHIKNLNVVFDGNTCQLYYTTKTGIKISSKLWSDGILLFLGYLTLLHSPFPPSLILVEEPENGVHPHRLESIISYLKKLSKTTVNGITPQVILTTHSPILLDYVSPEDVLVFYRTKEEGATIIRRLPEIETFKKAYDEEYLLGEFWTAFGEESLMGEKSEA